MTPSASDERPEPPRAYRALRFLARAAVRTFYSTVEATGLENVDASRPTIYAPTHPNSIIDPLLVGLFEERQIYFVARDGLFKVPIFGSILRSVGAIPVARRSDHEGKQTDNDAAFAACREALEGGGVLVLFPEGKTHGRLRVEPLKTGLARIALSGPADVRIIPIGLNYLVRHAFRSDVHVAFGEPIPPTGEVRELTERVQETLRELTVHIEQEDDERLIAQVTAIIAEVRAHEGLEDASPAERVALVQRVIDAYRWLGERDPERTAELRERILALLEERAELGLGGERPALQHRGERRIQERWTDDRLTFALGAPFALYGIVNHIPSYLALRGLLAVAPPSFYRGALVRLGGGLAIFAGFYVAQTAAVAIVAPPLAVPYFLSLVPSGLFARRYLAELRLHRIGPRRILRMFKHRGRMAYLKAERDQLAKELAELRRDYLASVQQRNP